MRDPLAGAACLYFNSLLAPIAKRWLFDLASEVPIREDPTRYFYTFPLLRRRFGHSLPTRIDRGYCPTPGSGQDEGGRQRGLLRVGA